MSFLAPAIASAVGIISTANSYARAAQTATWAVRAARSPAARKYLGRRIGNWALSNKKAIAGATAFGAATVAIENGFVTGTPDPKDNAAAIVRSSSSSKRKAWWNSRGFTPKRVKTDATPFNRALYNKKRTTKWRGTRSAYRKAKPRRSRRR